MISLCPLRSPWSFVTLALKVVDMPDGIIDMQDMGVIFSVTDLMGIHRESVSVELTKEDPGLINKSDRGIIEITIPETGTVEEFAQRLRSELEGLGYEEQEMDEEDDEDED